MWELPGNRNGFETSVSLWHSFRHGIPLCAHSKVVTCILHIAACRGMDTGRVRQFSAACKSGGGCWNEMSLNHQGGLSVYLCHPGPIVTQQRGNELPTVPKVHVTILVVWAARADVRCVCSSLLTTIWRPGQCTLPCWLCGCLNKRSPQLMKW